MLIKEDWTLLQILRKTWKLDLYIIIVCTLACVVNLRLIQQHFYLPALVPTVLGTAVAFFIGFTNNQAYDRWWEARTIWGALVNDSRSFARSLICYADRSKTGAGVLVERMIYRQIGFVYALNTGLRRNSSTDHKRFIYAEDVKKVEGCTNIPNALLTLHAKDLENLQILGAIDGFRFLNLDQLVVKLCDSMGGAERIKSTVFPTSYIYFTKVSIYFFIVLNTIVLSDLVGYWAIPFGWIIGFVFFASYNNGLGIMNPFENHHTDTPMNAICRTIEINLLQEMGKTSIPEPLKPINDEYLM